MGGNLTDVFGGHAFNAEEVEPQGSREPLPAGWYNCIIEECVLTETKDSAKDQLGNAYYLKITHQVMDGEHKGRKIFQNVTMKNPSQEAEEIGMRQLSALGRATGQLVIENDYDLNEKLLQVKVKVVPPKGTYSAKNEVTEVKSIEGAHPAADATKEEQAPAQKSSTPPWKKKG